MSNILFTRYLTRRHRETTSSRLYIDIWLSVVFAAPYYFLARTAVTASASASASLGRVASRARVVFFVLSRASSRRWVFGFIAVARRPSVACLSRHHTWRFVFHVTKRVAPRLCARCRDFTWRRASGARARARTRARVAVHSRCAVRCARDRGAPWAVATARARERERGVHERRWRIVCVRLIARAQTRGDGERARRTRREALEV